jgi:uncharacterized protein (TIGR00375 family)
MMAKFLADFHIHSKYSRATSKYMDIDHIAEWACKKGIDVIGTGDFTHPGWMAEIKSKLTKDKDGLYPYKGTRFILTAEVSNIYTKYGRGRRIHNIIVAPNIHVAEQIQKALARLGNISSDGRPIFGFDAKDLVKLCLDISEDTMIVPAHIWTPWFSLFGAMSGFESIEECFQEQAQHIYALETGLSSDPAMNWRVSALDKYSLISNSDAHSLQKIGREANMFDTDLSYQAIIGALKNKDTSRFVGTVEFFPEEGKYHYDGHRVCDISFDPRQTKTANGICPVCNKPLTIGVLNRVEALADRPAGFTPCNKPGFKSLVPLNEIIASVCHRGIATQTVTREYEKEIQYFGNEYEILLEADASALRSGLPEAIAEAVLNVRQGNIQVQPGYDGVYGKIQFKQPCHVVGPGQYYQKELV